MKIIDKFTSQTLTMELLYLFIGLVIGGLLLFFYTKTTFAKKSIQLETENQVLKNNELQLKEGMEALRKEMGEKGEAVTRLVGELSKTEADYSNLDNRFKEKMKEVTELQDKFRIEFKNLANEILEEKSKKFTEQNKINLNEILQPLGDKIKDFEKKVEETYDKESKMRFSLKEEIKRLEELNQQVSRDTVNLTRALKGDSKAQGNWGEVVLENILEKSGLVKDREYFVQSSYTTDDGNRLQPDVVVSYPGNRNVVIDSKVSLTAYERYVSAETESEQEAAYKEHSISLKNHISELSKKNYQDIYQLNSLDFVMMFLPVEPAYLLAVQRDPELWNYAYDKRILLISPTNLIAALKMVESLWRQEYQGQNVQEIAKRSGDLYDKFVGFIDDLIEIGNKLKATQKAYEGSMNKLSEGKGSLVKRVETIKKLGAKTSKSLPQKLLDRTETQD